MTSEPAPLANPESESVPSLIARLRRPQTIASFLIPIAMLVLLQHLLLNIAFGDLWSALTKAAPLPLLAAIVVFYAGFPLRGRRWAILLEEAGVRLHNREATGILFVSWFVNVIAPAKLGDVYRAYLTRQRHHTSMSMVLGTVAIERMLDIVAVAAISISAAALTFANMPLSGGAQAAVIAVLAAGLVLVIGVVALLLIVRHGSVHLERLLPDKISHLLVTFTTGLFSVRRRRLPVLILLTGGAWTTEASRLALVLVSLGLISHISLPGVVFVAMAASLLTVLPFTPGGLGVVEGGVVAVLTIVFGFSPLAAASAVLLDRAISTYSLIPTGAVGAFLLSRFRPKTALAGVGPTIAPSMNPDATRGPARLAAVVPESETLRP